MTLANFNSNFNWQYRMLKEAADCCAIIPSSVTPCYCYTITAVTGVCSVSYLDSANTPQTVSSGVDPVYICAKEGSVVATCAPGDSVDITGGTVACSNTLQCQPVVDCYWYGTLHDYSCNFFNPNTAVWTLNGVDVFSGWYSLMQNPPYGTVGNALQYNDPAFGCGPFNQSDYYFWTMVPSNVLSLPDLTGNDSNGNPILVRMSGPICGTKCYEKTFTVSSTILIGFTTTEINAPEYSLFTDLSSPAASINLTSQLGQYYAWPPLNVTVTEIVPFSEYQITIQGLYSNSNTVLFYFDDTSTVDITEVPCL